VRRRPDARETVLRLVRRVGRWPCAHPVTAPNAYTPARGEAARERATAAAALYGEMGMASWLEQAELERARRGDMA